MSLVDLRPGGLMVKVFVMEGTLHLEVKALDKLWTINSKLEIPLVNIRGARVDPTMARAWWRSVHPPGTQTSGVIVGGSFNLQGKRIFWDIHDPQRTIVIELADERYSQLIIEVADPASTVRQIQEAIRKRV